MVFSYRQGAQDDGGRESAQVDADAFIPPQRLDVEGMKVSAKEAEAQNQTRPSSRFLPAKGLPTPNVQDAHSGYKIAEIVHRLAQPGFNFNLRFPIIQDAASLANVRA